MFDASIALDHLLSELARGEPAGSAGFTCAPEAAAWRMQLWGNLAPTWAGNVSLHCYASRIGILRGDALCVRDRLWAGTFLLEATPGAANPGGFDFLQMARRRPSIIPPLLAPEIIDVAIERRGTQPSATVQVLGRDQLGFLAHVLGRIASCGLEPHHISLRTTDEGLARDRFVVLGTGGAAVTGRALHLLEERMRHPESA